MTTVNTAQSAFLRAIAEHPDDDGPRLAYADWLDEQGEADRAAFIRLQCCLGELDEDDPARRELFHHQSRLLSHHAADWLGHVPDGIATWFERGLLAVSLRLRDFLAGPPAWLAARLAGGEIGRLHLDAAADPDGRPDPLPAVGAAVARLAARAGRDDLPPLGLNLAEATLTDDDLAPLARLPTLTELDLHRTGVGDAALAALAGARRLEALWLTWNPVGGAGLAHLRGQVHLRELELSHSAVADADLPALAGFVELHWLALAGTPVHDLAPLAGLTRLAALQLANTAVADDSLPSLAGLTELRRLDLSGTVVTNAAVGVLTRLPHLRVLNLSRCQFTPGGLTALRHALPNCRVLA